MRQRRHQEGNVSEASGAFHIRYWSTELRDGKAVRVQKSKRLCAKDNKHYSPACKAVRALQAAFMGRVNLEQGTARQADVLITQFWETVYKPHLEKTKKPSTLNGYSKVWKGYLEPVFAGVYMGDMDCPRATTLLTRFAEQGLGVRSVAHIKALASGLFQHAKRLGNITTNPFTDAASLVAPKESKGTHAYSLEEAEAIFNALSGHLQEQLIFCLATFCGLRPGEIAALQRNDVELSTEGWLHVRRATWRGHVGATKTEESVASIPLFQPVRGLFEAWFDSQEYREKEQVNMQGWVFPNRFGDPMDLSGLMRRVVIPICKAKRLSFHGLYAGRRAAGTLLTQLTGNAVAASYVLRHKNLATTTAFYVKPIREEAVTGMRLLEEKVAGKFKPTSVRLETKALTAGK